jgi:hypothetical protein
MNNQEIATDQTKPRWVIDLDWYQQNNRSFLALARSCLCPGCRERLRTGEISSADLLATIKDCCSKAPDFITARLPVLERIFRLFLAGGNQPLDVEELGKQLADWCGGETCGTSAGVLSRLLASDQYYGLRQSPD